MAYPIYRALANLEVNTVESLIQDHTRFALEIAGMKYIDRGRTLWLVHSLMHELSDGTDAYVPREMIQPGVVTNILRSLTELRTAMVSAGELRTECFVEEKKGQYLKKLLKLYEEYLSQNCLVDFAGLINYIRPSQENVCYIAMPDSLKNRVSKEILHKLSVYDVVMLTRLFCFTPIMRGLNQVAIVWNPGT